MGGTGVGVVREVDGGNQGIKGAKSTLGAGALWTF